jgi:hypothetical protein
MWYSLLALMITFSLGIIISFLTNRYGYINNRNKELDPNLLFSFKRDFNFSCSRSNKNKVNHVDIENNDLNVNERNNNVYTKKNEDYMNKTTDLISNDVL